jgi:hypothetical protein
MPKYGLRGVGTSNDRITYLPFLSFLNSTVSLLFLFRLIQSDKLDRQSRWHELNLYMYTKQSSRQQCKRRGGRIRSSSLLCVLSLVEQYAYQWR